VDPLYLIFPLGGLLLIALSVWLAWAMRKLKPSAQNLMRLSCVALVGVLVLALFAARAYPGPAWRYEAGSFQYWLHMHVLSSASYLAIAMPVLAATLAATFFNKSKHALIAAGVVSAITIPAAMVGTLVIACNHAGACL
jgi:nitric oxide reductase large subunit